MTAAILFGFSGLLIALLVWELISRRRYTRTWAQSIQVTPPPPVGRFPRLTFARLWASVGMVMLGASIGWAWQENDGVSTSSIAVGIAAAACFLGAARNGGMR